MRKYIFLLLFQLNEIHLGSRFTQKAYSRFMLNDLSLCPKNPDDPSPATYYPNNFSIKKLYLSFTCTEISTITYH